MTDRVTNKSVKFREEVQVESDDSTNHESEDLNRQFNKFELLELVEGQETADLEEDDDEKSNHSDGDIGNNSQTQKNNVVAPSTKQRQRKRRGKGKSSKSAHNPIGDQDEELKLNTDNNKVKNDEEASFKTKNCQFYLLKLDAKNLIPENELKRIFGKSVLKEEKSKEHRPRHHFYPGASSSQRSRFVSLNGPHDTRLMHITSGPKMELDELFNQPESSGYTTGKKPEANNKKGKNQRVSDVADSNQPIYFKFIHDKSYQEAHFVFLDAALRGHPESIVQNYSVYPNHVESLIQLSDMIRVSEDYKTASDLIERALLIFEKGFHQKFNLTQAACRLSYKRPENRTFFITIFKHIAYMNRRGLRRTPLEYTKLLLSLDPENDPLFATLLIDFYAIRSQEYDFLIDFITKWHHLSKLPNINLSLALAHFMKSRSMKLGKSVSANSLKLADEYLQTALLRYPNFIIPLLDACSAEPDNELKNCAYFDYSVYSTKYKTVPESVDLLVNLYVQRNSILWKTKYVMTWLEKNIATLVGKFANGELKDDGKHVDYWLSLRGPSPRNLLRHIVLSDSSVKVPPSATRTTILDIDPYPPESITSYSRNTSSSFSSSRQTSDANLSSARGIPGLFIRSMLPSFMLAEPTASEQHLQQLTMANDQANNLELIEELEQQLQLQAALEQNEGADETAINLVQNSIQNVLSSLSNLLLGAEGQPNNDDQRENDQEQQ